MRKNVTIKLGHLEAVAPIITRLFTASFKDMKTAYALGKNAKVIAKELEVVAEMRQRLVKEYAQHDQDGKLVITDQPGMVTLNPETKDEFWTKFNELMTQDVELELWMLDFRALAASDVEISPKDLIALEFMIDASTAPMELKAVPPGEFN